MQPSKGGFFSGGYQDYSALQRDAARRLERMESRARRALDGGGMPDAAPQDFPVPDTEQNDASAGRAVSGSVSGSVSVSGSGSGSVPGQEPDTPDSAEKQAGSKHADPKAGGMRAAAPSPAALSGERTEQIFLLLLIYILAREKSDPCLIAALVYLLL